MKFSNIKGTIRPDYVGLRSGTIGNIGLDKVINW